MKKRFKEKIYEYINDELSEDEKLEFERIIKEDSELRRYYHATKKFYTSLKYMKEEKIPHSVEYRVLSKIMGERKKRLSLSFGFALTIIIVVLMLLPFPANNIKEKISVPMSYKNHKFIPSNYVSLKHVKEIGITVYVKDEKIEEKSGKLSIPKDEFTPLYETLKDKGEVEINYIRGSDKEQDIITVSIDYKNYPSLSGDRMLGFYLPYIIMGLVLISPIFFFIKRRA